MSVLLFLTWQSVLLEPANGQRAILEQDASIMLGTVLGPPAGNQAAGKAARNRQDYKGIRDAAAMPVPVDITSNSIMKNHSLAKRLSAVVLPIS